MDWARILAYVTGVVDQELLARNEYLAAENRILKARSKGRLQLSDAERALSKFVGKAAVVAPWLASRLSARAWIHASDGVSVRPRETTSRSTTISQHQPLAPFFVILNPREASSRANSIRRDRRFLGHPRLPHNVGQAESFPPRRAVDSLRGARRSSHALCAIRSLELAHDRQALLVDRAPLPGRPPHDGRARVRSPAPKYVLRIHSA